MLYFFTLLLQQSKYQELHLDELHLNSTFTHYETLKNVKTLYNRYTVSYPEDLPFLQTIKKLNIYIFEFSTLPKYTALQEFGVELIDNHPKHVYYQLPRSLRKIKFDVFCYNQVINRITRFLSSVVETLTHLEINSKDYVETFEITPFVNKLLKLEKFELSAWPFLEKDIIIAFEQKISEMSIHFLVSSMKISQKLFS